MDGIGTGRIWLRHAAAGLLGLVSVLLPVARGLTALHPPSAYTYAVARSPIAGPTDVG